MQGLFQQRLTRVLLGVPRRFPARSQMVPSGRACSRDPLGWPSSPAPAGTPLTTLTHTSACPPKAGNARKHHRGTDDVQQTRCTPTLSVPRRALRVQSLGAFPQRAQEVVVINTPVSRMRKPRHRQRLLGRSQVESRGGRIRTQVVRPRVCSQPRWVGLHPPLHLSRVESHCALCRNEFNAAIPLHMLHCVPSPPHCIVRAP